MSCPFGVVKIGAKPDDEITTGAEYNKRMHLVLFATCRIPIQKLALRS
jgi:hypothetical protein